MKIQITLDQLQRIIEAANRAKKTDSSLSETLEIELTKQSDTHLGGDMVGVVLKSGYAECNGQSIFWNK